MSERADAAAVVRRVAALAAGTRFVGIDGFGGAGKTTLAERVAAAVPRAVVVHVDDFAAPDVAEWDWPRFRAQVLDPLARGRVARYQVGRWDLGVLDEWRSVEPGRVVVVEGVSCTRREVDVAWDLTVWVEAGAEVRRRRAVERDGAAVWPVWAQRWIPAEQAYAARERPQERVDLIVDGDDPRGGGAGPADRGQ